MEYDYLKKEGGEPKMGKPLYKNGWVIFTVILIGISMLSMLDNYYQPNRTAIDTAPSTPPIQSIVEHQSVPAQKISESTFSKISLVDQNRMKEIITGVMQNTIIITPEIKTEFKNIIKKYNATDAEINDFVEYGPYFMVEYQTLFYSDALQSVLTGAPYKSNDRLNFEKEALSRGLMTSERVKANDQTMVLIASRQPITKPDGSQVYFTEDNIRSTLKDMLNIMERMLSLYK